MKVTDQIKPSFAPVYAAAMYPDLCSIFQSHGFALAVHGSLARDFDLIAVPWVDKTSTPDEVLCDVLKKFAVTLVGQPEKKPHGRISYTLSVGFGECACDLSFVMGTNSTK